MPKHIVDMTEAERIEAYQRGWNDSARQLKPDAHASILYFIGYREQARGVAPRFEVTAPTTQTLH